MDVQGMYQGAHLLTRPADEYENDSSVEALWVRQACKHADIYYNLISTVNPSQLKLTAHDDRIFDKFNEWFPNLNLKLITEEDLKSEHNKNIWREFCQIFKDLEDFSFGTLLRMDVTGDFSEENTILVTRIQFLAIEIARNRLGYNDCIWAQNATGNATGVMPIPELPNNEGGR